MTILNVHLFIMCEAPIRMFGVNFDRVADMSGRLKFVSGVSCNWSALLSGMLYFVRHVKVELFKTNCHSLVSCNNDF